MSLSLDQLAFAKGFNPDELSRFGVRDANGNVEIPYFFADGKEHERVRIRTNVVAKNGSTWSPGDAPVIPYGLNHPVAIEAEVCIVEGETDAWSLWCAHIPALGIPGASNARKLHAKHIGTADKVFVIREPGEAGSRFPHAVAMALHDTGFAGSVFAIVMPDPYKDPQEAFAADRVGFQEKMRVAVAGAVRIERQASSSSRTADEPRAHTSAQFLSGGDEVEHIIEGLLPCAGSALLGAKKKVGKSVVLLNIAMAVGRGGTFLGRRCKQGTVLYLSLDESKEITRERALLLGICDNDPIIWITTRTRPTDWERWLREIVIEHRPVLIIVDTMVKLGGITKIEDYGQWNEAYKPLYRLADEFGCAFIVSAHNRKNGAADSDAIAGSTAAVGGVDTIIVLEKKPNNVRTIMTEQRHGEDMERCGVSMNTETMELSIGDEMWLVAQREVEGLILDVLGDQELTREEIIEHIPRATLIIKRALSSMTDSGIVNRHGDGKRAKPYSYAANAKARPRNSKQAKNVDMTDVILGLDITPIHRDQANQETTDHSTFDHSNPDQEWTNVDQAGPRNEPAYAQGGNREDGAWL